MKRILAPILVVLCLAAYSVHAAALTAGNVVVLICSNTLATGNSGALLEYNPSGSLIQTFSFPTNGAGAIVFGSTVSLPHDMSVSGDGGLVVFSGYALLNATSVEGATAATDNRVIATLRWDGVYATPIVNSAYSSANAHRGVASDGLGKFWGSYTAGLRYMSPSAQGTATSVLGTGSRMCAMYNGHLYATIAAGVQSLSPDLPTGAGTYVSYISGATSAAGFAIPPGPTAGSRAYICNYNDTSGIFVFAWDGVSAWSQVAALKMTGIGNAQHIAVDYSGANPVLYFTTTSGANNGLFKYTDTGITGTNTITPTTLATCSGGAIFRGVAMAPTQPALPSFTTSPANTQVNPGSIASFGPVSADNANPLLYFWKADFGAGKVTLTNGPTGHGSSSIGGANTATLYITNAAAGDLGTYYAEAVNNGGTNESTGATLSFFPSCLTTNLVSITNVAGTTATFSVATGVGGCSAPLTYVWNKNGSPLSDGPTGSGSTIAGSTTATLTISNVGDGDGDGSVGAPGTAGSIANYGVTVYDVNATPNASSATLTVLDPPAISTQPTNVSKAQGQNASFNIKVTGGSVQYQWYRGPAPVANGATGYGSTVSGAQTATLTITSVQDGDSTNYSCIATNLAGTTPASDTVTLTVGHPPTISGLVSAWAYQGSNTSFSATVGGSGSPTLTWKHGTTVLTDDGHYFGTGTSALSIIPVGNTDGGTYLLAVTNAYGGTSASFTFNVAIAPPKPHAIAGQIIYDPFDYPTGPYPAVTSYSWANQITVWNQASGQPAYWAQLGGLNSAVQQNDLVNYVSVNRTGQGEFPWPGMDCHSVNMWYFSSAANNNHLVFGGVNQTNGAVYFSCLLHLDQGATFSQGTFDTIGGLTGDATADGWNYKLCTQVSNGGDSCWLGVFKGGGSTIGSSSVNGQWALAKTLARGELHLVVGCYKFNSGTNLVGGSVTNDDIVSLWIDPDRSTFGASELNVPAPDAGGMVTNWGVNAPIVDFGLKGTVPPASKRVAELRIGTTWASVTHPYYPTMKFSKTATDSTVTWPAKDTPFDPANSVYRGYTLRNSPDLTTWADDANSMILDVTGTNYTVTDSLVSSNQFFQLIEKAR